MRKRNEYLLIIDQEKDQIFLVDVLTALQTMMINPSDTLVWIRKTMKTPLDILATRTVEKKRIIEPWVSLSEYSPRHREVSTVIIYLK